METFKRARTHTDREVSEECLGVEVAISPERASSMQERLTVREGQVLIKKMNSGASPTSSF